MQQWGSKQTINKVDVPKNYRPELGQKIGFHIGVPQNILLPDILEESIIIGLIQTAYSKDPHWQLTYVSVDVTDPLLKSRVEIEIQAIATNVEPIEIAIAVAIGVLAISLASVFIYGSYTFIEETKEYAGIGGLILAIMILAFLYFMFGYKGGG